MRPLLSLLTGSLLLASSSLVVAADSLCRPGETTYFACPTADGRQVALCGHAFDTDKLGLPVATANPWLQYRYGRPGKLDMQWPAHRAGSLQKFSAGKLRLDSEEISSDDIRFVSGKKRWRVEKALLGSGGAFGGVLIGRPEQPAGEETEEIACTARAEGRDFLWLVDFIHELEMPVSDRR